MLILGSIKNLRIQGEIKQFLMKCWEMLGIYFKKLHGLRKNSQDSSCQFSRMWSQCRPPTLLKYYISNISICHLPHHKTWIERLHLPGVKARKYLPLCSITSISYLKFSHSPFSSIPSTTPQFRPTISLTLWLRQSYSGPPGLQPCPIHHPNPSHLFSWRANLIRWALCLKLLRGSKYSDLILE